MIRFRNAGGTARRVLVGAVGALALLWLLPDTVHACPVCFDARDENRQAFLATTVFLSLFPLGMVAGVGLWVRKRARDLTGSEGDPVRSETDADV